MESVLNYFLLRCNRPTYCFLICSIFAVEGGESTPLGVRRRQRRIGIGTRDDGGRSDTHHSVPRGHRRRRLARYHFVGLFQRQGKSRRSPFGTDSQHRYVAAVTRLLNGDYEIDLFRERKTKEVKKRSLTLYGCISFLSPISRFRENSAKRKFSSFFFLWFIQNIHRNNDIQKDVVLYFLNCNLFTLLLRQRRSFTFYCWTARSGSRPSRTTRKWWSGLAEESRRGLKILPAKGSTRTRWRTASPIPSWATAPRWRPGGRFTAPAREGANWTSSREEFDPSAAEGGSSAALPWWPASTTTWPRIRPFPVPNSRDTPWTRKTRRRRRARLTTERLRRITPPTRVRKPPEPECNRNIINNNNNTVNYSRDNIKV